MPWGIATCDKSLCRVNPGLFWVRNDSKWCPIKKSVAVFPRQRSPRITNKISTEVLLCECSRPVCGHGHLGKTFHWVWHQGCVWFPWIIVRWWGEATINWSWVCLQRSDMQGEKDGSWEKKSRKEGVSERDKSKLSECSLLASKRHLPGTGRSTKKGCLKTFSWYCHICWDLFGTSPFISLLSR